MGKRIYRRVCDRRVLAIGLALAAATSVEAAVITYSGTAPTLGADDIANFTGATFDADNLGGSGVNAGGAPNNGATNDGSTYVANDRAAQGQTFLTGSNSLGYTINSLTYRLPGYTNNTTAGAVDNTYFDLNNAGVTTIRVGSVAGTVLSILDTETAAFNVAGTPGQGNSVNGVGTYITFTFDTPITLLPNTTYGVDVGGGGTGANFFETLGIRDAATGGNPYTDGSGYTSGATGSGNTTLTSVAGDRVFVVDLTPVPEPGTLGLIGMASLGLLARRRRHG